jgi:hypothetical protein
VVLAVLVTTLAGCSTHPLPDDVTRKTTFAIVEQIRCEAQRAVTAYADYAGYYKTAAIAYEFDFQIDEHNNAQADGRWTIPFAGGGSFSLLADAGSQRGRNAHRNFKIVDGFDELRAINCTPEALQQNWIYPIAGDIGIYEVVSTFLKLQKANNPKAGDVFTFADTLTFTTSFNGGVKPKLVLNPATERFRLVEANFDFNASRTDVHKVVLTLTGGPVRSRSAAALGSSFRSVAASSAPAGSASSLVSTTIIQAEVSPKDRALLELDRQRILALQARAQNLLIGP